MFFVSKNSSEPLRPASINYVDREEGISSSSSSSSDTDTSGEDLEASYSRAKKGTESGLATRFTEYARGRRKSFADWKRAQPRSTWAMILLAVIGTLVILYVSALVVLLLAAYQWTEWLTPTVL